MDQGLPSEGDSFNVWVVYMKRPKLIMESDVFIYHATETRSKSQYTTHTQLNA